MKNEKEKFISQRNECTLQNCEELKQMIIQHPDYPLIIFCGEDSWSGDYQYTQVVNARCAIQNLALYNNELWLEEDDYEERLQIDLSDNEEYKDMGDEEFYKMISKLMEEIEFLPTIVIYA